MTEKNHQKEYTKLFTPSQLKYKIVPKIHLTKPFSKYDKSINKYGVKCGQTLAQWESKGWITKHDPYGWFQWYCQFFKGRRIEGEDERQIQRWLNFAGPKGRFSQRLKNMVKHKNTKPDDPSISPVIRQSLLHWAWEYK